MSAGPAARPARPPDHAGTRTRIEQLLRAALAPAALEVSDHSAAHAGHAGAAGKGHFRVRVVSTCFSGLSPLQRHRLVNETLAPLWSETLHAVSLTALTPDESIKTSL